MDYSENRCPAALIEHRRLTRRFQRDLLRCGLVAPSKRVPLSGTAHACGTLACGLDENDSVVDRRGKVHGMKGLYVVDGSVLPRSSSVNPSLTIYAWALSVACAIAAGLGEREDSQPLELAS
jgi:choline dehydrogenase-like flavoprotein